MGKRLTAIVFLYLPPHQDYITLSEYIKGLTAERHFLDSQKKK